ncbi:MAG: hypothetical protein ACOZAL_00080, partial [Patescibacteria group bacterium]
MKKRVELTCNRGDIVIIHRPDGWKVEVWKDGKAPLHDYFSWDINQVMATETSKRQEIYPNLKDFPIGTGLVIGRRLCENVPYYFLDGISLIR